jgi:phosphatidylglycerol:prolipoprotein diacylglycerol transferase
VLHSVIGWDGRMNRLFEGAPMIPYVEQPSWQIGPLTIHAFGVAVATAIWFGLTLGQRRADRVGLDPAISNRLSGWVLIGGLLGAHLFSALFYFPAKLVTDPWYLLRVWEDISSLGGMLGGMIAAVLFFRQSFPALAWRSTLAYADVVAFAFAPALAFGRIGCVLAHDHPGRITRFPLAVSLESSAARDYLGTVYQNAGLALPRGVESMGFHDLGLYEFLLMVFVIVPVFAWCARHPRPPGFYVATFAGLYFPVRFGFDSLRVVDARYVGLTPAQWVAAVALVVLPLAAMRHRKVRFAVAGAVILLAAWACWSGS